MWNLEHRTFVMRRFYANNESVTQTRRDFRRHFNVPPRGSIPDRNTILRWMHNVNTTGSLMKRKPPGPTRRIRTPENVDRVRAATLESPNHSDDYKPGTKGKAKAAKGKKRKTEDDYDESEDEWSKPKEGKKGPGAEGSGEGCAQCASAFTKPFKLSPELADVVGTDVMARQEVVQRLWDVIQERKLQDPANRQFAICDEQLKKVFGSPHPGTPGCPAGHMSGLIL